MFHIVFGKTVPDISLNAVANLDYADCRFLKPVYPGDTLNSVSEVIGLKENSNKKTGINRGSVARGDSRASRRRGVEASRRRGVERMVIRSGAVRNCDSSAAKAQPAELNRGSSLGRGGWSVPPGPVLKFRHLPQDGQRAV